MIGEAVRDHVLADSGVSALCDQMYPHVIPQTGTYPAMVFAVESDDRTRLLEGTEAAYRRAFVSIDCYAKRLTDAQAIADAVESALTDFRGTLGTTAPSIDCDHVRLDRRGPELFENETELHRVPLVFVIGYERV